MGKRIYLDYGATTLVDKKVLAAMMPFLTEKYGNAMSLHSFGKEANEAVEEARKKVADFFGADPVEIVFTSGATESNNLVVKGVLKAYYSHPGNKSKKPHIITSAFEHHCVLDACKEAERDGLAELTYLNPGEDGLIRTEDVKKAIKDNTILVSIMYVNNEIGTVQPIKEIGQVIKKANSDILFHTDATQAVNYLDCQADKLKVDFLSMSGHKIYGPKGIGVLYIRKGSKISRVQDGGGQENRKRAGTHNVPGIVGLGSAISEVGSERSKAKNKELLGLRNLMIHRILKEIPNARLNGSKIKRSPNNANFSFRDVEGESLLLMLDMEGIACSTGSACSSGSLEPSHVLMSLGLKHEDAHGSIRVTMGKYTTKREIEIFISKLKKIVGQLRKISGKLLDEYYQKSQLTK